MWLKKCSLALLLALLPAYAWAQNVGGLAGNGAATAGNPVWVCGSDGTDCRAIKTDSTGALQTSTWINQTLGVNCLSGCSASTGGQSVNIFEVGGVSASTPLSVTIIGTVQTSSWVPNSVTVTQGTSPWSVLIGNTATVSLNTTATVSVANTIFTTPAASPQNVTIANTPTVSSARTDTVSVANTTAIQTSSWIPNTVLVSPATSPWNVLVSNPVSLNATATVSVANTVQISAATLSNITSAARTETIAVSGFSHASTATPSIALLVKNTTGFLYGYNCTALAGGSAGFCVAYNSATVPASGAALTSASVLDVCYFDTSPRGCSLSRIPGSTTFGNGIVVLITIASSPFTFIGGTASAFISADYQ